MQSYNPSDCFQLDSTNMPLSNVHTPPRQQESTSCDGPCLCSGHPHPPRMLLHIACSLPVQNEGPCSGEAPAKSQTYVHNGFALQASCADTPSNIQPCIPVLPLDNSIFHHGRAALHAWEIRPLWRSPNAKLQPRLTASSWLPLTCPCRCAYSAQATRVHFL